MDLTPLDDLASALDVHPHRGELIALVGGGGKTTSLFALGAQLATGGRSAILTTTTKMGAEQTNGHVVLLDPDDTDLRRSLDDAPIALVWHDEDGRRALGVEAETCDRWFGGVTDHVIVEADGSRKRPFKAPADYEPVVPTRTTLLVGCIGVGALGRPIAEVCHRPELVAGLADCAIDDPLTPERAARVLTADAGSRKGLPASARYAVLLHRVTADQLDLAAELRHEVHRLLPDTPVIAVAASTPPS